MATLPKTEPFRIRLERGRKARAEKILRRFGLSPAEAVNVFFAKVEEVGGLPFDLRPEPDETGELLRNPDFLRALAAHRSGKSPTYSVDAIPD